MHRSETRRRTLKLLATVGLSTAAITPAGAQSSGPTADFSYRPSDPSVGDRVTLDGTLSSDPDGTIDDFRWSVDDAYGSASYYSATPSHTWDREGTYTVRLEVTDSDGNTAQTSKDIRVNNFSPTADFEVSPTVPLAGESVTLDGTHSTDVDGTIESYDWSVEEEYGSTSYYSATPTHTWDSNGTYSVTLEVTDNGGATGSVTRDIGVGNTPPTAEMTILPSEPDVGETVTFRALDSSDPENNIVWREWHVDGTQLLGLEATYTFESAGKYEIELLVRDSRDETDTTNQTLYVGNVAPEAAISYSPNSNVTTERTITFDARDSTDPDGQISTYEWTFPDSTTKTGPTIDHQFGTTGTQNVSVAITDNEGKTATKNVTLQVAPPPTTSTTTTTSTTETTTSTTGTETPHSTQTTATPASRGPLSLNWVSPSTSYERAKAATLSVGLTAVTLGAGAIFYRRRSNQPPELDAVVAETESQLTDARHAASQGNPDTARSTYASVINSLEEVSGTEPAGEDATGQIAALLQTAKQERDEVEQQATVLDKLTDALSRATTSFQRATASHATRSITVAIADYRTAATAYETAIDQLDASEIAIFDEGYSITVETATPSIPNALREWPNLDAATIVALEAAGISSLTDLTEMGTDELEALEQRDPVSSAIVNRLRAAQWWVDTRSQTITSRSDIVAQLERAKTGQRFS